MLSLSFGADRHFNVRAFNSYHVVNIFYVILPITGRLLTDSLLSLLL